MKRKTLSLIMAALLLFTFNFVNAEPCDVTGPSIHVNSSSTGSNGTCIINFDFSVYVQASGGNKYVGFHLWQDIAGKTLPDLKTGTTGAIITNSSTYNPLATILVDNQITTQHPAITVYSDYAPDATYTAQIGYQTGATLTVGNTVTIGGVDYKLYTFTNMQIAYPGACDGPINLLAKSWSATSGSTTPKAGCQTASLDITLNTPNISTVFVCDPSYSDPTASNRLSINFTNPTSSNVQFKYSIYRDVNNDGVFNTGDVQVGTTSSLVTLAPIGTSPTATPTDHYNTGYITIPNTTTVQKNGNLLVVVSDIVVGTVTQENTITAVVVNNCLSLPVNFGAIKATNKNGQLIIDWQTLTETNAGKYVIQASKDGVNWKDIGELKSKAPDGTTTDTLLYQLIVGMPISFGAISLALLLLFPAVKNRRLKAGILAMATILVVAGACTKQSKEVDVAKENTIYIRIAQFDKDGSAPTYSRIVKVFND